MCVNESGSPTIIITRLTPTVGSRRRKMLANCMDEDVEDIR